MATSVIKLDVGGVKVCKRVRLQKGKPYVPTLDSVMKHIKEGRLNASDQAFIEGEFTEAQLHDVCLMLLK